MAYYSRQNDRQKPAPAGKPYISRIYMMRAVNKLKDGTETNDTVLISFDNYWFVNRSKSGAIYGRITISGDYNVNSLNREFGDVSTTERGTPVTLFFFDRDAEYLDKAELERCNKSFVARVYVKDGGLCAQVLKLF